MLGVGFDAHVVHHLSFPLKRLFGKGAYVLPSIAELTRYAYPPIRMRIDEVETEAASVIISQGPAVWRTVPAGGGRNARRARVFGGVVRPRRALAPR